MLHTKRIPMPSYIEDRDISLYYISEPGQFWPEHMHEEHQIIISAEANASCEISWRTAKNTRQALTVPGQNIIYIRAGTLHAFRTATAGAYISIGISQAQAKRMTMGNLWGEVRITPCWRAYREDLFLLGLVDVLCELCHHQDNGDKEDSLVLDLDPIARLLASRLLRLERKRKAVTSEGLTPLQLRKVDGHITIHLRETLTVGKLAGIVGLNKDHFAHLFKTSTGLTPHYYVLARRIRHFHYLRKTSNLTLAEIAVEVGFCDQSHLGRRLKTYCFRKTKDFRRNIPVTAGTSNTGEK